MIQGSTSTGTKTAKGGATKAFEQPDSIFLSGDLVAGRFRVIQLLATGGMGEVYEVEDQDLGERLALKVIRPELARDEINLERFRRELQLARRVTHRNVCRLFDLVRHRARRRDDRLTPSELACVTMELLEGETLADRLRRVGRLPPKQVRRIVHQVAEGLAAAHEMGIVHRDLKTSNIMLVPDGRGGERAVVMDFGLARLGAVHRESESLEPMTRTGQLIGTPDYMAPEQVAGGRVTPATDVYALGVLMYEAITGRLPFYGKSAMAIALKRLHETPETPIRLVDGLEARWEAVILRCLEADPELRFQSTVEILHALDLSPEQLAKDDARPAEGDLVARCCRYLLPMAILLVCLLALEAWRYRDLWLPGAAAQAIEVPQVAVLGFSNGSPSGQLRWVGTTLADELRAQLAAQPLEVVPGHRIAALRADLPLPEVGPLSSGTLEVVAERLSADYTLVGSYSAFSSGAASPGVAAAGAGAARTIQLRLWLQEVASGKVLLMVDTISETEQLPQLAQQVNEQIRSILASGHLAEAGPPTP